ncbi:MAG: hypothetical protein JSV69_03800 [Chloroflexota bacterium]|nr:MAG: hypothetical protein JSV69_03800 [Chloroflexota bacterium]
MNDNQSAKASMKLKLIIESAQQLGVEISEAEALQWLSAMAAESDSEISMDLDTGVFGHKVVMLDFSPVELARFRAIGRLVEFKDEPGVVETALALSGSSAQSKIQTFPGDCDYFERVNIIADTREEACQILARIMRDKALGTFKGPTWQLIEVKMGSYPFDMVRGDDQLKKGSPISWSAPEIQAGKIEGFRPDGTQAEILWDAAAADPGWCKLDWVIADPARGKLANASNMLDVTWEAPDGSITPLDNYLDAYFQEVYLEAESVPIFSKLMKHASPDVLDEYVAQLENEVNKYLTKDINYGKAAKRMYNVFRLTGRYEEAAFLRELFDEPTTMLYQVWSLIRTIDDSFAPGSEIPLETVIAHTDQLIFSVIDALEGDQETEIVRRLLTLRDSLTRQDSTERLSAESEAAREHVINIVNNFFYEKLNSIPTIKAYMDDIQSEH